MFMNFCLFANDLLNSCNYSKFTGELCPMPSAAQINALKLDAPSLFQLIGRKSQSGEQALTIYKYNDDPIMSVEDARQNKDATFNSIFDIQAIQEIAESYNLKFSRHIILLPGLKTAKILGIRNNVVAAEEPQKTNYKQKFRRTQMS
ncbi:hypothetical protein HPULCUR_003365 [Helicostylum pulchrum]|uniref:Uncharacterized protein n=1 Tax=Helicostylum pulchrum TaxID=562976 RepID=A0ABP9XT78_9FUNG